MSRLSFWDRLGSFHGQGALVLLLGALIGSAWQIYDIQSLRQVVDHGNPATATVIDVHRQRRSPAVP